MVRIDFQTQRIACSGHRRQNDPCFELTAFAGLDRFADKIGAQKSSVGKFDIDLERNIRSGKSAVVHRKEKLHRLSGTGIACFHIHDLKISFIDIRYADITDAAGVIFCGCRHNSLNKIIAHAVPVGGNSDGDTVLAIGKVNSLVFQNQHRVAGLQRNDSLSESRIAHDGKSCRIFPSFGNVALIKGNGQSFAVIVYDDQICEQFAPVILPGESTSA